MNRAGRVRTTVLLFVSGGILAILLLGLATRSCTQKMRSAPPPEADDESAPSQSQPTASAERDRPPRPIQPRPVPTAPKLDRSLIGAMPSTATIDASSANVVPDLTDEEKKAIDARRARSDIDKAKLLRQAPP